MSFITTQVYTAGAESKKGPDKDLLAVEALERQERDAWGKGVETIFLNGFHSSEESIKSYREGEESQM